MDGVEDWLSESQRDEGSGRAVAYVDDQLVPPDVDVLEVQPGSRVVADPPKVRVKRLLGC